MKIKKVFNGYSQQNLLGFHHYVINSLAGNFSVFILYQFYLPAVENDVILVTDSATTQASPDLVPLRVGIQSFAKTAQKAASDNNLKIEILLLL